MEIIQAYGPYLLMMAAVFGLYMAWGIGANDVANAMGTSVGTKSLTVKQAILIAMVFEFAGAYLAGGEVTDTVRKGIVDLAVFKERGLQFNFGFQYIQIRIGFMLVPGNNLVATTVITKLMAEWNMHI